MLHEYCIHDDGSFPCRRDDDPPVEEFDHRAYEEAAAFGVQHRA